ncbi:hypothetical protein CEXT_350861 [Caerostris extrusa]|uniref:Uncharacterized protein n=1 Tax=Caerostris extrusa TaxID=172846 RepID=A0AAV4QQL3_CAEEX|nr:hypothetical protein CEXT_350861 [Caerostris extrusa]
MTLPGRFPRSNYLHQAPASQSTNSVSEKESLGTLSQTPFWPVCKLGQRPTREGPGPDRRERVEGSLGVHCLKAPGRRDNSAAPPLLLRCPWGRPGMGSSGACGEAELRNGALRRRQSLGCYSMMGNGGGLLSAVLDLKVN